MSGCWTSEGRIGSTDTVDFDLAPCEVSPYFDRYDIAEAWQVFWGLHHGGQFTQGYRNLCRAQQVCTSNVTSFERLSENGQAIYRKLERENP